MFTGDFLKEIKKIKVIKNLKKIIGCNMKTPSQGQFGCMFYHSFIHGVICKSHLEQLKLPINKIEWW